MDLPYNKIIVDSRHVAAGNNTNFSITLPESLTLPQTAVLYVTDICVTHTISTFGGTGGTINNQFYFIERLGDSTSTETYLNRASLDATKSYEAFTLATEIQNKINAVSVLPGGTYTVTYDIDRGFINVSRPQESGTTNSFYWPTTTC